MVREERLSRLQEEIDLRQRQQQEEKSEQQWQIGAEILRQQQEEEAADRFFHRIMRIHGEARGET